MIHFEHEGGPDIDASDLVELAESHLGVNLANTFVKVLEEFGIKDKVG